jgi:hypothetical protein
MADKLKTLEAKMRRQEADVRKAAKAVESAKDKQRNAARALEATVQDIEVIRRLGPMADRVEVKPAGIASTSKAGGGS